MGSKIVESENYTRKKWKLRLGVLPCDNLISEVKCKDERNLDFLIKHLFNFISCIHLVDY